jgi:CheY-like chemotaxis protein
MKSRPKILLVEDEGVLAASLVEDLDELGYTARPVNSGDKALSAIAHEPPDLVLMDIKLKGHLDGIQASERVHRNFGIPVIFLTAHSDRSLLERAKLTEPFGYLIKPVGKRDLSSAIEIALYKSLAEKERLQLIDQLKATLAQVRTLEGMLPICSHCKKIRDSDGRWVPVEQYISARSHTEFTHSICQECSTKYYPAFEDDVHPE